MKLSDITEAVTDMPSGTSPEQQLNLLISKLESCKRALKIAGGLGPEDKKKYIGRIIQFMYDIRMAINKVARELEAGASN